MQTEGIGVINPVVLYTVKAALATLPVPVTERDFRVAARRTKKNIMTGRQMLVRGDDITDILRKVPECRRKRKRTVTRKTS